MTYLPQRCYAIQLRRGGSPVLQRLEAHPGLREHRALGGVRGRRLALRAADGPAAPRAQLVLHRHVAAQAKGRSVWMKKVLTHSWVQGGVVLSILNTHK